MLACHWKSSALKKLAGSTGKFKGIDRQENKGSAIHKDFFAQIDFFYVTLHLRQNKLDTNKTAPALQEQEHNYLLVTGREQEDYCQ